jgi:UDP-N-acetylmuramyl pentapeptide synthase
MNFESLVVGGFFKSVEAAIAHEFGFYAQETKFLVIKNGDSALINDQVKGIKCDIKNTSLVSDLKKYKITLVGTEFDTVMGRFIFPYLLPKQTSMSVLMTLMLMDYLDFHKDLSFAKFKLPPGRNSFFKGIKNITIVDSTYNANVDSMEAVINMFDNIHVSDKWVVLGDMLEQGLFEKEEHERLAAIIIKKKFERIILMGPRTTKYMYPKLNILLKKGVIIEHFLEPKEVLDYLLNNIQGGETILFKGARFLEGVVENLLLDKNDVKNLARREKVWEIRRKKWGL